MKSSICVRYANGGWSMLIDGRESVHFDYRVDAIEAALQLAAKLRLRGKEAVILLWDRYGELSTLTDTSTVRRPNDAGPPADPLRAPKDAEGARPPLA